MRVPQSAHVKVSKIVLVLSTLLLVAALAHWKHFVRHPYRDGLHHRRGPAGHEMQFAIDPPMVDGGDDDVMIEEREEQAMSIEPADGNGAATAAARRIDYRGMQLSGDDATPPVLGRDATGPRREHGRGHEGFLGRPDEMPHHAEQPGNTGIVPPHLRNEKKKSKSHSNSKSNSHSNSNSHSHSFDLRDDEEDAGRPDVDSGFAAPHRAGHMSCRFFKRLVRAIRFHLGQAGKPALLAAIAIGAVGVVAGFTGSSCAARAWRFVIFGSFTVHLVMLCLRVRDPGFCPALLDHVHKARGAMIARVTTMMAERPEQPLTGEKLEQLQQVNGAFDEIDADPRGFCMRLVLVADFAIAVHHIILLLIAGRLHKVARDAETKYQADLEAILDSAVAVAVAGTAVDAVEMCESAPLKTVDVVV